MMKSRGLNTLLAGTLLAGSLMLVGCSDGNYITASDIRANMTPELKTTAMNDEQHKTRIARSVDHTLRQIWDDLDYLLLLDQPSRLTTHPIP